MEAHGIDKSKQVGTVVHHDLDKNGKITYYDVDFGGNIITGIPAKDIIPENKQIHEHETRK
jgi:hypothetical protein